MEEDQLAKLYAYDMMLLDLADTIREGVDKLEAAVGSDDFPKAMSDLLATARQAIETFNRREETITGS